MSRRSLALPPGVLVLVLALLGSGCVAGLDPPPGVDSEPIIGGASDPGRDLAVVMFQTLNGSFITGHCTASLISPRVVLTAAHCVVDDPSYRIIFADAWDTNTNTYPGALDPRSRKVVKAWHDPAYNAERIVDGHDVALALVDGPPPASVKPVKLHRDRVTRDVIGKEIRFIGYGEHSADGDTTVFDRQYANAIANFLGEQTIGWSKQDSATCHGDSGGPTFITTRTGEELIAVTSWGLGACQTSNNQRIDVDLATILQFIADNDPQPTANCGADGICGWACPTIDPDCPCTSDGKCTSACLTPDADPDCPMNCLADGVCQRSAACAKPDPDCGTKGTGATCTTNDECLSATCVPNGATRECVPRCDTTACPAGFACSATAKVCLRDASSGGSGGCAVAGRPCAAGHPLALALAALVLRRRRPRRADLGCAARRSACK